MFKLVCLFLALLIPGTCCALEIRRIATYSGIVLRRRGDIQEGDYSRIKSYFRKAGMVGLDMSSDGGILEEGLRIANLAHDKSSPSMLPMTAILFARLFSSPRPSGSLASDRK